MSRQTRRKISNLKFIEVKVKFFFLNISKSDEKKDEEEIWQGREKSIITSYRRFLGGGLARFF
jgi:hypothetical protein